MAALADPAQERGVQATDVAAAGAESLDAGAGVACERAPVRSCEDAGQARGQVRLALAEKGVDFVSREVDLIGGHHPAHVDQFARIDKVIERFTVWLATTRLPVPLRKMGHSLEEVAPIIAALWTGTRRRIMAVNVPNRGYLPNVPDGAIVEVGAEVDGDGIHPETMPPIAEPIAGHIATQLPLQKLIVQAALTGDREPALRAVIEDPTSPPDERACRAMFDELVRLQAADLPFA